MACTTILVGKNASFDGSTMIARNDDSGAGHYTPKKYVIVHPEMQPRTYTTVLTHCTIQLPDDPMRYSAVPNALPGEGIWAACGVNEKNVGMTATETITSNERVLGADPLVEYVPAAEEGASGGTWPDKAGTESAAAQTGTDGAAAKAGTDRADAQAQGREIPGGIGEEDFVVLVLPYISSAREGVLRLGSLLEQYGTNEMNGIAFSDKDEIWWMETIGGHHWMARRLPDDRYAVIPNQLGMDELDLEDALGEGKEYLCSKDLKEFIEENHLDLSQDGRFDPRAAFGSHDDADHVYNTPRAWYMLRFFNPHTYVWDGPDADYTPLSDDLPWSLVPEKKITTEDVKYILSSHFQGTPYDPYLPYGDRAMSGAYRCIGVNRTDFMGMVQIRPDLPEECCALQWLSYGSNVFNAAVPFYPNVPSTEEYLSCTGAKVSTDSWYWANRLIAALADASYRRSLFHIERYISSVQSRVRAVIRDADGKVKALAASAEDQKSAGQTEAAEDLKSSGQAEIAGDSASSAREEQIREILLDANRRTVQILREETDSVLLQVLDEASNIMKNQYARSDA